MNNIFKSSLCVPFVVFLFTTTINAAVLEEVTVTAQKREQQLQDVGIAVTAFTGEQQRALGFTSSLELEMHTPGLRSFHYGNGAGSVMVVRGVGQLDFADHQEQASAVFHDGAYNSYLGGVSFALYDIDRIEVLKGPQGSLFGRNATGGVVHMLTKRPTREYEGYAEFQGAEFDNFRGEMAISGPLTDTLSARFSAVKDKADGYVKNSLGEDGHDKDNTNARLQFLWQPSDDLEVHFKARFGTYDNNNPTYIADRGIIHNDALTGPITGGLNDGLARVPTAAEGQQYADFCDQYWASGGFSPTAPTTLNCLGTTMPGFDSTHDIAISPYTQQALASTGNGTKDGRSDREQYGFGGTITWDISDTMQLVSITDWQDFKKDYREDVDGMDIFVTDFYITDDSNQWSQELRLHGETDRLKWILGFYYLNIEHEMLGGLDSDAIFVTSTSTFSQLETDTYAFFGHGEYAINDQWSAIVGLRWTEDEKDIHLDGRCNDLAGFAGSCTFFYGGLVNDNSIIDASRSEGEWSGTFELNWRPNDDLLLYAKYARGNKAGSFNTGFLTLFTPDSVEFDGEVLTNYEGGFKSTWMDGRLRFNGSMFYYDYEDFQSFFQLGLNFSVHNLDANVLGGELELIANPVEGLDVMLGLSLLDATQEDVDNNVITRDRRMPFAPDMTFNGLVRYEWPALSGMLAVQFDWAYTDDYTMAAVDHPALLEESYWLSNAKVGWSSEDGSWELSAWVKNLNDADYYVNGFDTSTFSATIIKVPAAPRIFGGTIRYNWGG